MFLFDGRFYSILLLQLKNTNYSKQKGRVTRKGKRINLKMVSFLGHRLPCPINSREWTHGVQSLKNATDIVTLERATMQESVHHLQQKISMNSSLCSLDEKAIEISQLKQDLEIINISNSNVAIKLENLAQTPGQGYQDLEEAKETLACQGGTGIKGETGLPGLNGIKGEIGNQGQKGVKGDMGETGPRGQAGGPGSKGDKGEHGPNGLRGETGSPGEKGDDGAPGENRKDGLQGAQGEKGERN
ncbi:macrophage receptor MARCO-like isoform X2 [Acipenser ruthenus]|uniref:macrophage receptor MARCO-like isoform X2 n=1 Tax=Acipenser ruthenus TaxID=7906 RepID=UPI002741A449|nr:macrophage receptor MARCO-like isoform X2 [Acipenser ruthenus]